MHGDLCKHLGIDSSTDHPDRYSNLFLNASIIHVHAKNLKMISFYSPLGIRHVFQRELSIIDFTLNYPPIRNNLTSAILLSMFIETDYLNYPPIRNNLTSASLLSMISEMDFNLVGYESHDRAALPCRICRARNTFFLSRSTKRCNSIFFFALSSANSIINNCQYKNTLFFYRNNDFNGDLTCVRGMKAHAAPCRAWPLALVAVYHNFFNSRLLEHLSWLHFY